MALRRGVIGWLNKPKIQAFHGDGLKDWSYGDHFSHTRRFVDIMPALGLRYARRSTRAGGSKTVVGKLLSSGSSGRWSGDVDRVIHGDSCNSIAAVKRDSEDLARASPTEQQRIAMQYASVSAADSKCTTRPVSRASKQINRRSTGTEKCGETISLEPLLKLKADDLSETHARRLSGNPRAREKRRLSPSRNKTAKVTYNNPVCTPSLSIGNSVLTREEPTAIDRRVSRWTPSSLQNTQSTENRQLAL